MARIASVPVAAMITFACFACSGAQMGAGTGKQAAGGETETPATRSDASTETATDAPTETATDTSTEAVPPDDGEERTVAESGETYGPNDVVNFLADVTCDQGLAAFHSYLKTFDPGVGLNELPAQGQVTTPVDAVADTVIMLSAPSIASADGTRVLLDASSIGSIEATTLVARGDKIGKVKATRAALAANEVDEAGATGILVEAAKLGKLKRSTTACVFVDLVLDTEGWTKGEFSPKTAGTTATIKRLDLRDTNQTVLNHVHVEKVIVCPGVTSLSSRVKLNASTYDTLTPEPSAKCP